MRVFKLASSLLAGASLCVIGTASFAQSASAQSASAQSASAQSASAQSASAQSVPAEDAATAPADSIVVTGSRTIKNGDNSPTPVTVVATEALQNVRPTSLTESILILPVFSGSRGQISNPSATGGVGGGNGNAAQLNLRNIGGQRNLVLMDGRRVPPASFTNIVDADVIPQLLIQRVDVVTGGVSAVYGSDAITGVVNFITDKAFNGIKAQAQAGISEYGDGAQREFGIAVGTTLFGGRGHFEASYEFRDDDGVLRRSDRPWFNRPVQVGNGTTVPYQQIGNATLSAQPFGGRITCTGACAITGQYFATDGVLSPFVNGTTYTGTTTQSGGAGGYLDNSLKAKQRMHQLYGRFDFDVSDNTHFFISGGFNFKHNEFFADDVNLSNITLNKGNAFLPAAISAQIPTATFRFDKIFNQPERFHGIPETRQIIVTTGLEGKIGGFDWDIAYTHGDSRLKTVLANNVNNQKLSAALDAVVNGSGQTVCYATTQAATAAAYANCVPLNLFGPTSASTAAIDYVLDDTLYVARTKLDDVVASVSGSPFDTWAGPVNVALSGEWRKQTFSSTSDATPSMFADCTSLRYNCVATGARTFLYRQTFAGSGQVRQQVTEGALEVNVPLLKDTPLFQSLDVNGAARYTHYDTVGNYWTWKGGLDWHVTDDLRFRGTISRDIRAPTLNDLYAPTSVVIVNNQDLKTGATNPLPSVNVANPALTAEIGNTKTFGVVYKPHAIPGLSFAVDYYDIKIKNAIVTVQGFQPAIQNGCNLTGVALYCDLITRDSGGTVTQWLVRPVNLAQITTHGIDFETNYQGSLFGRPMAMRLLAAYQPHIRYIQPAVPIIDQGGVAFGSTGITASPSWRLTGLISFAPVERLRVDVMYRWRNRLKVSGDATVTFAAGEGSIAPFGQASLNLAWQPESEALSKAEFFLNIQNLFNANPPLANATGTSTAPGGFGGFATSDDPIGRYFTAGVRIKF
jgi:iron complex outermembrane receptor protein